jgi:hypothetical protein
MVVTAAVSIAQPHRLPLGLSEPTDARTWLLDGPLVAFAGGDPGRRHQPTPGPVGATTQAPRSPLAPKLQASRHRRSTVGGRTGLHGSPWDDPVVCLTGDIGDAFEVGLVMQHGESG